MNSVSPVARACTPAFEGGDGGAGEGEGEGGDAGPGAGAAGCRPYSVAVRSLCEFTARTGDLSLRFTPSPTARQGIAGHAVLAGRRGAAYERELSLSEPYEELRVRGRADGYDATRNRLEEFKTHRGDLEHMPANQRALHWAQLKMYGAMLCKERALPEVELALVYFDIKSGAETELPRQFTAVELREFFAAQCERFLSWARQELRHRQTRDRFLGAAVFPHAGLHSGQRRMAEAVYRAARSGRRLMIEAPTGIGKTIGSLFPMLKALPAQQLDKIFFLVAKTSGRALALEALRPLRLPGNPAALRVLELASKESSCRYPGRACDAAECPLASGFYDRLPQAREAAMALTTADQQSVGEVAAENDVCPYFLTQELVRWADVIVGDFNYFFDTSAMLHGLLLQNQWRVALLVDEAHNLLPRARAMYSATLDPETLAAALPGARAPVRAQLGRLERVWRSLHQHRTESYFCEPAVPTALIDALELLTGAIADDVVDAGAVDAAVLRLHFAALHFCRMAEAFGAHSLFDVTRLAAGAVLCIRNVSPASFLAPRFAACAAVVLFSATLSPAPFYRSLLGLPSECRWLRVDSPFRAEQLDVRIERGISTRYGDRGRSLGAIADLLAREYAEQPGNYLAFFSSFDYLRAVMGEFKRRSPDVPVWEQTRAMVATDRAAFLARFATAGRGIGFAVLGGVFAEGVDLPGDRLIGAFIVTLGLPQVNAVNAEIERRMQTLFDAGFEYTYLYPGLQKVVQAAGRVIRSVSDRGRLVLIDDRYLSTRVRDLLPAWWRVRCD